MTHDPWQTVSPNEEPTQAALAGVDLVPKQGGYSLQDILSLHDSALQVPPAAAAAPPALPTVGRVAGPEPEPTVAVSFEMAPAAIPEPATPVSPPPMPAVDPAPVTPPAVAPAPSPAPPPNPFAAFAMPAKPAPAQLPGKPAKRGGLPIIDPSEFAAAPIDRIEASSPPEEATPGTERSSEVQLHALQQSLAALDELEAQFSMLAPDPVPDSEPVDWVDALATATPSPIPIPSPGEPAPPVPIGPTTADDVVTVGADDEPSFSPTPIERLEPAGHFPFPGMHAYGDDAVPLIAEPVAIPPTPGAATVGAGDPPFFFHLDGEPVDLATDMGIATCEEAARSAIAEAGRAVQVMLEGQQRQRRMQDLMAKVHAGGLSVDEVISVGQDLQRLRDEINRHTVDRRAISQLVARLEQQRALMGRLIDLLWRT